MAKKTNKTENNNEAVVTAQVEETIDKEIKEAKKMTETLEAELAKQIEEVSNQVAEEVAEVKAQEADLMAKIEENPEEAEKLIQAEVERVDEALKALDEKIEKLTGDVNKNNVVFTTTTWNGWGYDG